MAHTHTPRKLPTPEVQDSDFGAFEAAVQAQHQHQQDPEAERLIAWAKARSSHDGYVSWPAYADQLEQLVRQLVATHPTGGRS